MASIISIKNLTRDYGQGKGIFNIDLEIGKGEVFGFLGPNGAGKTTTIRHLMGFIKAKSGSVQINGLDCFTARTTIQQKVGYIPGEIAFFDEMKGQNFLKFVAKYRGQKSYDKMHELAELFEINLNVKIKKMSKGMKQKIGIISAFMHDPEIIILDEPSSGLDPLMQNKFIELVKHEKTKGKTILLSSHIFEEVERTCDRIGIIKAGRIVATDSVDNIKKKRVRKYVVSFATTAEITKFKKEGFLISEELGMHLTVEIKDDFDKFINALPKYKTTNLAAPSLSLEEVFLGYYG